MKKVWQSWTEGPGIPPWSAPDGETPDTERHISLTDRARFQHRRRASSRHKGGCDAVKSQPSRGAPAFIRHRWLGGGRAAAVIAASAVVLGSGVGIAHADVNPA